MLSKSGPAIGASKPDTLTDQQIRDHELMKIFTVCWGKRKTLKNLEKKS